MAEISEEQLAIVKEFIAPDVIKLYAHNACPMVPPVLGALKSSSADFEYVNIYQDAEARLLVRQINNGYESVPTLVFPDGSTLTEPSGDQLYRKLKTLGYRVPITTWLLGNSFYIILIVAIIVAALRIFGVF